jgi:hypothetical protein
MSAAYALSAPSRNWRRVSHREPCPVCRHPDWCRIFDDGGIHCMRREDGGTPCSCGGWMHWPGGRPDNWQERIAAMPPPPPRPVVDTGLADRAYRELLARCPLSDADRASFHRRGETDEDIARHGYGTLSEDERARNAIAVEVECVIGRSLAGVVPGWVRKGGRTTLASMSGILIPVIDHAGRIVGLRVRARNATKGKNKYFWLSYTGDGDGESVGQDGNAVHVATPRHLAPDMTDTVWAVEGEIKSNITADRLGVRVLSVPGVTNIANVIPAMRAIGGITKVIIGYDKDTKPETVDNVARAENKLARQLAAAGFTVMQAKWSSAAGKGVDDILTSTPIAIPWAESHPALDAPPMQSAEREEFARLRRLHSLTTQARHTKTLGPERHTLTDLAVNLSGAPEGEWVPMPYSKLAGQSGIPERSAQRHLEKAGIRPRERSAGLLDGLVEVEVREVPQRINPATGEIVGGYDAMHVRRRAPVDVLLERIITAPVPEAGMRNNHGGKREPCLKCGSVNIRRITTDICDDCGEPLKPPTVRIIRADEDDTPHVKMSSGGATTDASSRMDKVPSVIVYKGDILSSAPHTIGERAVSKAQESRERLDRARANLIAKARNHADFTTIDAEIAPPEPYDLTPIVPLFPLDDPTECVGCGAYLSPGQRYCADCDPRGA